MAMRAQERQQVAHLGLHAAAQGMQVMSWAQQRDPARDGRVAACAARLLVVLSKTACCVVIHQLCLVMLRKEWHARHEFSA